MQGVILKRGETQRERGVDVEKGEEGEGGGDRGVHKKTETNDIQTLL